MSKRHVLYTVLLLVLVVLSACAPNPGAAQSKPGGLDQLVKDLEGAGAQVEMGEATDDSFFSVPGRNILVNGLNVTVFEFADEAAQQAAAATIQGGGFIIGQAMVDWIDTPHFWAKDRLIALYVGKDAALVELLGSLLGEQVNPDAPSGGMAPGEEEAYVKAARAALSQQTGIDEAEIILEGAEKVDWTDSCLGLGGPAESCLQVITPGYNLAFHAKGVDYEVHTDETGEVVRIKQE